MSELRDDEWAALKAARSGVGRPLRDERTVVEAIVWRMRNGAKWRAVPGRFGPWWRAAQLHGRWSKAGVWERAFARLRDTGGPALEEVFLDGASIRAHRSAAGARGGGQAKRSGGPAAARAPRSRRRSTRWAAS